ncbi:hypothetical protein ACR6C2_20440 [Streptomyces sp. INA 01156]
MTIDPGDETAEKMARFTFDERTHQVAMLGTTASRCSTSPSGPTAGSRTVRSTRFPEPAWARSCATAPSSSPR